MSKWCFNYESGNFEHIDRDGFSTEQGTFVYNWDKSEYEREDNERDQNSFRLFGDQDDD